jgi:prepilin-type N-terminal cleavage/methylation domain-containing protein
MKHSAFTLLEMTITLTILAMAVSLVVVNYREPVNHARLDNALEQIDLLDRRIRHWTKTNNIPVQMKVDLDRGILTAVQERGDRLSIPEVKIPDGMKLKELRIIGERRFGRDTVIRYTSQGIAPCWAYSVVYSGNREAYRLMIGATGQSLTVADEEELKRFEKMNDDE